MVSRSTAPIQTSAPAGLDLAGRWRRFAETERAQWPLWLPVAFGAGIAGWFGLPWEWQRLALACALAGLGLGALLLRWRVPALAALVALAGMGAVELRVAGNAHPVLAERQILRLDADVLAVERRAGGAQRLLLAPLEEGLPRTRLTIRGGDPVPVGARVRVRAMLSPPAGPAVPGGLDLARRAWFDGIGATGVALGPITLLAPPPAGARLWLAAARTRLQALIMARVPGEAGAVSAAFITGSQGAIPPATAQAMRDAGLAHLLSISGLHIAVVVGGMVLIVRRTLALWPWLALRAPVRTLALAAGALAGVAYTLLAGAQVPTVRSIIAALIVLLGMLLGREAFSLRLLGAAAMAILAVRPEVLLGASFQLSFAAVMGIIALYESRLGRWLTTVPEAEHFYHRTARQLAGLLASGLVAEAALSGIGLYHFGRAGLYGVLANMIAIPWTSLAVLPALALALAGEALGTTAAWPLAGWTMAQLIALADFTAARPGAVLVLPAMPVPAFALLVAGGLWLALWRSRARWWGLAPIMVAVLIAASGRPPDLLVSADGRHVAWRLPDGRLAFSRARVGDFLAETWSDTVGGDADQRLWLGDLPAARCSPDACMATIVADGRRWQLLATTSREWIDRAPFAAACARADIVVSDRRLPGWCQPRWLKLDRASLARSGAITVWLAPQRIVTAPAGDRPWQRSVPAPMRAAPPLAVVQRKQDAGQPAGQAQR